MIRLGLMLVFLTLSLGAWPGFYAFLGDSLYEDARGYRELLTLEPFKDVEVQIRHFTDLADRALEEGAMLDAGSKSVLRINYINTLRQLDSERQKLRQRIEPILDTLQRQGHYDVLSLLTDNPSPSLRQSAAVLSAQRLRQSTLQDGTLTLDESYRKLKAQLLETHLQGDAAGCLNDCTAAHYFMVEIEKADATHRCQKIAPLLDLMQSYLVSARSVCEHNNTTLEMTMQFAAGYDGSLVQNCR